MKRIALLILLFAAACAPAQTLTLPSPNGRGEPPVPTVTSTPEPTEVPATATPTVTGPVGLENFVEMSKVVDNWSFANEYFKQNAGKDSAFSTENGKLYLDVGGSTVEVDQKSAGVNVDINGKALTVEGTGFDNIISIHGVGENADKVYAYAPETTITLDEKGTTKTFEGGWFEVIKPNHPVDMDAPKAELEKQLLEAINDPVNVTLEQVQSGEWAESVLLSGLARPIPDDVEFTGNALNYMANNPDRGRSTVLYTSEMSYIPFFGKVDLSGVTMSDGSKAPAGTAVYIRPWALWNPKDLENPDRSQIAVVSMGFSPDRADESYNKAFIEGYLLTGYYPLLIVSEPDLIAGKYEPDYYNTNPALLQNLPGNDATDIQFFGGTIRVDIPKSDANPELWQWYYNEKLPTQIQNLIWLAYFINK